MSSGADLFVVCKQCGREVSPYITECPYCGGRLRRRAPKLPPARAPIRSGGRGARLGLLLRGSRSRPARAGRPGVRVRHGSSGSRWQSDRPHASIALVGLSAAAWITFHAEPSLYGHVAIVGPLRGEWWKLFSSEFAYLDGWYAFLGIVALALFGWLIELRHGPGVVLVLFFGAGALGALVALAVYSAPLANGGNAAALALLAAWAAPDLSAARAGGYWEGDLLGTAAFAALLLVVPFTQSVSEASWLSGVVGGAVGLSFGFAEDTLSRGAG